ncbi:MAG: hypothetical protein LBV50_00120 [Novosphingobium sp.]|jgi:hypothetical protein|nr:hypothetical protein [Novosphingobium sp.]
MTSAPTIISVRRPPATQSSAQPATPETELTLDLDERAVFYPAGKGITRLVLSSEQGGVAFDAVFAFNDTHAAPRILWLSLEDARVFGRALVDSVYQARAQNAITATMRIGITVHTNGFHIDIMDAGRQSELFIGLPSIWRLALLVLRAVDRFSPIEAH